MLTSNDYHSWVDEERWKIINDKAYAMTPVPISSLQRHGPEIVRSI